MRCAPSLLDKLCPRRGDAATGRPARGLTVEEAKDAVARDLEALLNTRRPAWAMQDDDGGPPAWPLACRSIAAYGIDDFSALSLASGLDRDRICESIRQAIDCHERRLRGVRVSLDDGNGRDGPRRRLRFVIRALLALQGAAEPVSFDARFEPAVQRYAIARGRGT